MGQLTSLRFFTPSIQHRARHSRCTLITRVDCELRVASSSPFHLHHPFEISRASRERERERAPLYREERPHRVNKCKYQKGRERRRELLSLRWICLLPSFFFSFFFFFGSLVWFRSFIILHRNDTASIVAGEETFQFHSTRRERQIFAGHGIKLSLSSLGISTVLSNL